VLQKPSENSEAVGLSGNLSPIRQAKFDLNGQLWLLGENREWQEAAWLLRDQETADRAALQRALAQLKVVWVPTEQVTLLSRFVPGKRRAEWFNALPYALEESLAEPVESLHFTALNRTPEGEVAAAVVTRARMQLWVEQLEQAGLQHAMLVADCFQVPLPQPADTQGADSNTQTTQNHPAWSVCEVAPDRLLVRSGDCLGFAASPDWFAQLQQLQAQQGVAPSIVWQDAAALTGDCATGLTTGTKTGTTTGLASGKGCLAFNLRSGDFKNRTRSTGYARLWRWPALLSLALLGLYLGGLALQTAHTQAQARAYQQQSEALFKQRFPEVKRIINVRTQAKSAFDRLGSAEVTTGPATQVMRIESVFGQFPQVQITRLEWRASNRQLSLQLQAPQLADLQQLSQAVSREQSAQLQVKNVSQTQAEGVLNVDAN
jgi:general secretion pathway protein L